jgi:hypothetical protein
LLGDFKVKPIQINPAYKELKEDLTFIAEEYFPKFKVPRFSVSRTQKHVSTIRFLAYGTLKYGMQNNIRSLSEFIYDRLPNPGLTLALYLMAAPNIWLKIKRHP